MKLLLDHQLIAAADAPALPLDRPGAYETLWWRRNEPVFWEDHWQRFAVALRYFAGESPWTEPRLRDAIDTLARVNGISDGVLRYMVWREGELPALSDPRGAGAPPPTWHSRIDLTPPRPHMAKPAFELTWALRTVTTVAGDPTLHRFKHWSRAAWRDATEHARRAGYDDALVLDESGAVLEAGTSNVFLVFGDELHTPALSVRPLPGVMRQRVIGSAHEAGLVVRERRCAREEVEQAEALWVTNSLIGIRPVKRVDNRAFQVAPPLLGRLREAWSSRYGWDPVKGGGE